MITDRLSLAEPDPCLFDAAWSVLDAANDLRDMAAVDACRRVIDGILSGIFPKPADIDVVFDYFN